MRSTAKFSKKHYVVLADVLQTEYRNAENPSKELGGIYRVAYMLADRLAADNPRFNAGHFLAVVRGEKELNSRPARSSARKWDKEHSPECVRINEKRGPYECICADPQGNAQKEVRQ